MSIRTFRPTSPSRRKMTNLTYDEITKATPEKSLTVKLTKTGGRNNQGVITTRHIGGIKLRSTPTKMNGRTSNE